jgi:hypothetical protein
VKISVIQRLTSQSLKGFCDDKSEAWNFRGYSEIQTDKGLVVEATSLEELKRIIYEMIEQQPNVLHTETLVSIFHATLPKS